MFDLIPRALSEWDEWMSAPFWVQLLLCVTFDLIKKETTPCNCFLLLSPTATINRSNIWAMPDTRLPPRASHSSWDCRIRATRSGWARWLACVKFFVTLRMCPWTMWLVCVRHSSNQDVIHSTRWVRRTPTQILYMYTPHMEKNCSKCCANWLAIIVAALELFLRIE